jgi:hypothetical protein
MAITDALAGPGGPIFTAGAASRTARLGSGPSPLALYPDGFSPKSLAGLTAWWNPANAATLFVDAEMTIPIAANGDPVGGMRDLSGNGYSLVQTTALRRPTYRTSAPGIRGGAVQFTASPLTALAVPSVPLSGSLTYVAVVMEAAAGNYFLAEHGADTLSFNGALIFGNGAPAGRIRRGGTNVQVTTAPWIGVSPVVVSLRSDGSRVDVAKNGVVFASIVDTLPSPGVVVATSFNVGARNQSSIPFEGHLGESVLYNRALTNAELLAVANYLRRGAGL